MTNIDLIILTLDEIHRSALEVETRREKAEYHKSREDVIFTEMEKKSYEKLNSIRLKLREVLEEITNFRKEESMIDGFEIAINQKIQMK